MKVTELIRQIDIKAFEIQSLRERIKKTYLEAVSEGEYKNKFLRYLNSNDWKDHPEFMIDDLERCLSRSTGDMVEISVSNDWDTNYFMIPRGLIETFLEKIC